VIGRLADKGLLANVGLLDIVKMAVAGGFIVAAVAAQYIVQAREAYVIAFSCLSLCFTGFRIVWSALRGLARLRTNVDELVSFAIVASMILGEWISAAAVAFIMVIGGLIEEYTSMRARRHIEMLAGESPTHARVIRQDGAVELVPIRLLKPGQHVLSRPGDVIPVDGVVAEGASDVDESMLTGESVPVCKTCGDFVSAGTMTCEGALKIRIERTGDDTTQGKIVHLVAEAEEHRAPILRAAEVYAKWFTPCILSLAAAVWYATGDVHRAVTMLIVGCPCAFVLATPTAVVAALGRASKRGILVKGGKYLEACAQTDMLVFDKTGTLTSGAYRLTEIIPLNGIGDDELLRHAVRLEYSAEHPIARAVITAGIERGMNVSHSADIRREAGLGVFELSAGGGNGNGVWRCGNKRFMLQHGVAISCEAHERARNCAQSGRMALYVAEGTSLRGMLVLEDAVRPETSHTLRRLGEAGYGEIVVLTGDHPDAAHRVADELSIPRDRVLAEMLPEDKYEYIRAREREGRRVCYVGDGTNDGPALAAATVGVSIGSRENTVALETADIVLMKDGLAPLPLLMRLAKRTRRTINENILAFGLAYNALMLILSAGGALTPILGALGHNIGSVAVVLNSARLLRFREDAPRRA